MNKPVVLIPARWASSRFPGKPLALIGGIPLILRVCDRASQAFGLDAAHVITDDLRIHETVVNAGYRSILREHDAATGTDRIADAIQDIDGEVFINVQGDEPLVCPDDIRRIYEKKMCYPNSVINGYCEITDPEAIQSKTTPKVVFDRNSKLLYMSRAVIPGTKTAEPLRENHSYFRQVCIYAFSRSELELFSKTDRTTVEQGEDIEILRFLMVGTPILMVKCSPTECAVDTPEDVLKVERVIRQRTESSPR